MNAEKVNKLKIAANQFYLNKYQDHSTISDAEYDALVAEYEAESGSVKDLIEFEKGAKVENTLPIGLDKIAVDDNDLGNAVDKYVKSHKIGQFYLNFKYDGGSIIGFYQNGRLQEVRSTPDEAFGIIRTKVFWNIFPHKIEDESIIAIQGEALVDWSVYGQKARNKANGLLNSVNQDEEAERELFVRVYKVYFKDNLEYDFKRSEDALRSLPQITRIRERLGVSGQLEVFHDLVFSTSLQFYQDQSPKTALTDIIREVHGNPYHDKFQVDGVVMYAQGEGETKDFALGFKFYYTESAVTTITNVVWNRAGSGSYQPKLNFETVTLNDKNISQAASGGYPNLQYMKMGKGAKVRVILSKMTIPKIIEVLEPSEDYELPTCGCGHKLNPTTDLFGSGLKCTELDCSERYEDRLISLNNWILSQTPKDQPWRKEDILMKDTFGVFNIALNIDRWDSKGKRRNQDDTSAVLYSELKELVCPPHTAEEFRDWMKDHFHFPGLCMDLLNINYVTADRVISEIFNSIT